MLLILEYLYKNSKEKRNNSVKVMATAKKMCAHFNSQIRKFPDLLRLYFVAMCVNLLRCQRLSTDGKLK